MNKFFLFAILSVFSLTACNKYKIEGTSSVSSLDGKMLFVKIWFMDGIENIDSCEIVHGKFEMKGSVDSVMMAALYMDDEPMMPIIIEKGNIKISLDNLGFVASGTPLNDKLTDFINKQNTLSGRADELQHCESQMIMDGKNPMEIQEMMNAEGEKLNDEVNKLVKDFIVGNFDNVLSTGIFMILCSNMSYPIVTPQMEEILKEAPDSFKEHPFIKEFLSVAEENTRHLMYDYPGGY